MFKTEQHWINNMQQYVQHMTEDVQETYIVDMHVGWLHIVKYAVCALAYQCKQFIMSFANAQHQGWNAHLDVCHTSMDVSKQRKLMCRPEACIVCITKDADDIDLVPQRWQLCNSSGFAEFDHALQQAVVTWATSCPLLMGMHESDEVQVVATQPVDDASKERANVCLIQVCQSCAEVSVVAITDASCRLQARKMDVYEAAGHGVRLTSALWWEHVVRCNLMLQDASAQ